MSIQSWVGVSLYALGVVSLCTSGILWLVLKRWKWVDGFTWEIVMLLAVILGCGSILIGQIVLNQTGGP